MLVDLLGIFGRYWGEDEGSDEEIPLLLDTLQRTEGVWGPRFSACVSANRPDEGGQFGGILRGISVAYCNLSGDRVLRKQVLKHTYTIEQLKRLVAVDPLSLEAAGRKWAVFFAAERQKAAAGALNNLAVVQDHKSGSKGRAAHLKLYELGVLDAVFETAGRPTCFAAVRNVCCEMLAQCLYHPAVASAVAEKEDWMALLCALSLCQGFEERRHEEQFEIKAAGLSLTRAILCADPPPSKFEIPKAPPGEGGMGFEIGPFPLPISGPFKKEFMDRAIFHSERLGASPEGIGFMLSQMDASERDNLPIAIHKLEGDVVEGKGRREERSSDEPKAPEFFQSIENYMQETGSATEGKGACGNCGKRQLPPPPFDQIEKAKGAEFVEKLMTCSRCEKVCYCSRECQKAHWKKHKPICKS
uniref:MYND-type domain-containing protein n=1 Tax=Chromera velia CCMP2878 TaxID=1169474 RepID=A0A0G4HNK6_9ALVE|eukprot:Cvel_1200.t1-p1 / transcript=Cvel_1200.t1 / gene=Cvel_1200 / organism=Chromera_velia_CCMP2878 / gene_product=hypothetical protein / transcript_product=hypothetical protein / location=Cvel_scaffold40:20881-22122(-) / protein_length=414 / sequence_SO=supercontig / SO=protein_coding / is_pseudo=false